MTNLKPCPFCGNDEPHLSTVGVYIQIKCWDCGIQTPQYHHGDIEEEQVIEDWNTRFQESKNKGILNEY